MTGTSQGKRIDVLAIICTSHVFLAKTNSVFALGYAIKNFQVFFRYALADMVSVI
jgi:hypothetical protein